MEELPFHVVKKKHVQYLGMLEYKQDDLDRILRALVTGKILIILNGKSEMISVKFIYRPPPIPGAEFHPDKIIASLLNLPNDPLHGLHK